MIFNYGGMSADDMSKRIVGSFERFLGTTVNDIEHIESQSLNGISIIKIYFQPNAKIEAALAQVTAISQTAIRGMPPGTHAAADHPVQRLQRSDPAAFAGAATPCPRRRYSTPP